MILGLTIANIFLKLLGIGCFSAVNLKILRRFAAQNPDLFSFHDAQLLDAGWKSRILPYARLVSSRRYHLFLNKHLTLLGVDSEDATVLFIASQIQLSLALVGIALVLTIMTPSWQPSLFILAVFGGCFYPFLELTDRSRQVLVSCHRDLPALLDYLSLAMGAGLEMTQALEVVVEDSSPTPIRDHFAIVFKHIRLGRSRAEALELLNSRVDHQGIKIFTQTLIQGLELGTDIAKTISTISETLQQKRFQIAEEQAGKISVRMMIPMMCFIMPSVMIILLAPMLLSYIQQGS